MPFWRKSEKSDARRDAQPHFLLGKNIFFAIFLPFLLISCGGGSGSNSQSSEESLNDITSSQDNSDDTISSSIQTSDLIQTQENIIENRFGSCRFGECKFE